MDIVETVGSYVALAAALGSLLLVPLFLSQRRDLARLHEWMDSEPDHPRLDVAASEAILDRAEAELERLQPVPAPTEPAAALRVTAERPALERITLEREALAPHPHWRHFVARATRPRVLAIVAFGSLLIAGAAIVTSGELLGGGGDGDRAPKPGAIDPAEVDVAVLNATAVPGLAAKVGDDVEANGFALDTVTNSDRSYDQTVVMFARGRERAAAKVAHALGVRPVQPLDEPTLRLAGEADVVVIAGEDRAGL